MTRGNNGTHPHINTVRLSFVLCPLLAFAAGLAVMYGYAGLNIAPLWAGYLSLAVLAGIDSVLGGVRAGMEGKFYSDVFISGFVVNTVVAVAFAWFGDVIGLQDVYVGAVIVFVWRIVLNISIVRRFFIERLRAQRAAAQGGSALASNA